MKKNYLEEKFEKLTYVLEMVIAVLVSIGIIIGLVDLIRFFPAILTANRTDSYAIFQEFLGYSLVLIVGVELMLMIIKHSTREVLNLILFVIARKMLIYSQSMLDLVLGTLAIVLVFIIIKYLVPADKGEDIIQRRRIVYPASAKVKDILKKTGFDIPADKDITVGDLVCSLADEACLPVEEGAKFDTGDIKIEVSKANDGIIEEVKISKK